MALVEAEGKAQVKVYESWRFQPGSNPEHRDVIIKSLRVNFPGMMTPYKDRVFDDCRCLGNAAKNRQLRGHIGTHPDNLSRIVSSKEWREGISSFPAQMRRLEECIDRENVHQVLVIKFLQKRKTSISSERRPARDGSYPFVP